MQHWASLLQLTKATESNSKIVKTNQRLKNVPHASLGPDGWQGNYDKNLKDLRKFEFYAYKRIQESNIVISNLSFFSLLFFSVFLLCYLCFYSFLPCFSCYFSFKCTWETLSMSYILNNIYIRLANGSRWWWSFVQINHSLYIAEKIIVFRKR